MTPVPARRQISRGADFARLALAAIRLFNGCAGLLAPGFLVRRLGGDPGTNPVALYALRLFGVRTVLVALELLWPDAQIRRRAIRLAPIIHASDTVAAFIASRSPGVPSRVGVTMVAISTLNTALSLIMQREA